MSPVLSEKIDLKVVKIRMAKPEMRGATHGILVSNMKT